MSLFVLADTHLSLAVNKPMDVFGERWKMHTDRIKYYFEHTVKDDDTVVLPGDISWGMTIEEALPDLLFLDKMPGKKIIAKGNHDYWWSTLTKIEKCFAENGIKNLSILFNNAYKVENYAICGTRGWFTDIASPSGVDREKIILREAGRLRRSLEAGKALAAEESLVFMHFPPVFNDFICRELVDILHEYGVRRCYYGHLHGQYNIPKVFEFEGIVFTITAADHLQFRPLLIE